MIIPAVVLPALYASSLIASGRNSGTIDVKWNRPEQLALVDGYREGRTGIRRAGLSAVTSRHDLRWASANEESGLWFRVDPELHLLGLAAAHRDVAAKLGAFRSSVKGGDWTNPSHGGATLAITIADLTYDLPDEQDSGHPGPTPFAAWLLDPDAGTAMMIPVMLAPEVADPLRWLTGPWPLPEIQAKTVAIIGVGSIGSAAAEALAAYGVGSLILIDPDRLDSHNFARHRVPERHLGRFKAKAMADILKAHNPQTAPEPLVLDVIEDADQLRPALAEADAILIASDGIDSRRAANHLSRRAGKPTILACVLEDGAFGEILRIRPARTGCLLCARERLREEGGMDPEPGLDRGYGAGTRHLPMTAVGGDLSLVGHIAAKATVATVLEDLGFREEKLSGDHAIIGLRPKPHLEPPFDIHHAGEVRWRELPPPRDDCPTCGTPAWQSPSTV